jgi:hypothetical protein
LLPQVAPIHIITDSSHQLIQHQPLIPSTFFPQQQHSTPENVLIFSATMPVKPPPKPKFNTLTTAGRVAKAAHERAAAMKKQDKPTPTPTQGTTTPPPQQSPTSPKAPTVPIKKKRKMQILPPPHELAAEAKLKEDAKASKSKSKKKQAPLTTKEKLAASAAAKARENKRKQPVVHDGVGLKAVENVAVWGMAGGGGDGEGGKGKGKGKGTKKAAAEKPKNLMDFMRDFKQVPSAGKNAETKGRKAGGGGAGKVKAVRESVLVRATERTMRLKAEMDCSSSIESEQQDDSSSGSHLMTLPLEVRQRIWRLVVVEKQFFVYPAISPEQPDLAMTSRQIRGEVLPLYYGENTFAVEVPVEPARTSGRVSLEPVRKWTVALAGGGHLGTIRKWALSLVLPASSVADVGTHELKSSRELILSLQYPKSGTKNHVEQPEIEIHRKGSCLLPGHEEHRQCARMCYPRWVDDALFAAFLAEKDDRGKQVVLFAASIGRKGHELVGSQCVDEAERKGNELVGSQYVDAAERKGHELAVSQCMDEPEVIDLSD